MCGRMAVTLPHDAMAQVFAAAPANDLPNVPNYNVCPTTDVAIITSSEGQRHLQAMRWGLIPHWAKVVDSRFVLFNARCEALEQSRAFRGALAHKRGVVPATSYIEWRKPIGGGSAEVFELQPEDSEQALALAAVWDYWTDDITHVLSCSVLTVPAQPGDLAARVPVVLDRSAAVEWLTEEADPAALIEACRAGGASEVRLVAREVDAEILDPRSKRPPRAPRRV